ncbi:hypothetical protein LS684_12445 [Cytobacillus spongiae]|uniref:hypothetical protein n=1 Tax=Cytobacillus spongiae TaxID=2901381 RepID=UPI001F375550|nr:hypothetical protein [Cytobacillus spongiae]UII54482.1 hypothetical protein LS684_12445 [Cytobacillus spongiae]
MDRNQILSLAIINVNYNHNIDYYDHFVPFVKEALIILSVDTISANDVKKVIIDHFKIDIPINVVNTILRNKLVRQGYVNIKKNILVPDYNRLSDSDFKKIKRQILEKHEMLLTSIIKFSEEKYNKKVDESTTENALQLYLENHQLAILETSLSPSQFNNENPRFEKMEEMDYIISQYIIDAHNKGSVSFEYLIDIVKGIMLTNTLYYKNDITKVNMKFKGTEVYFDSTFLIYALGYAGEARQDPCLELIKMLRSNNAILRVFRHNIDEIIGILEWCKKNLTSSKTDNHGTVNHFLNKGYGPADIERIIYALENELEDKLHIKVNEGVAFDNYSYVISHEGLDKHLKENMTYRNEIARERDVQSISAIARLRRGKRSQDVENSRAVFITNNYTLAQHVKNYSFDEDNPRIIPPALHDSILTNLVWLKNPSNAPDLPRKRLVAQTFAASNPQEHLWSRYIETVGVLESTGSISEEDVVRLRYGQSAPYFLMEKTLGDDKAISIGTVQEILEEIRNEEKRSLDELNMIKDQEINELKKQNELVQQQIATTSQNLMSAANFISKWMTNILLFVVALIIAFIVYSIPYIQTIDFNPYLKNAILFTIIVGPTLLGMFNINLIPFKNKVHYLLNKWLISFLKNRTLS